jgi:serine/threonine protein kinase
VNLIGSRDQDCARHSTPSALAQDPERLARFERKAKVLAPLNHPNMAAIYGVEDRALVMELVEGDSPKGPLPFDDARKMPQPWNMPTNAESCIVT